MLNYDDLSRKWLILTYRPGTGGKFLCACLLTIDKVAHWIPEVEYDHNNWDKWIDQLWSDPDNWMSKEPLHQWNIKFFSRQFDRGSDLSLDEFYTRLKTQSSEYFKEVLKSDKIILDFYHQTHLPPWWKNSYNFKLDKGSDQLWKEMLSHKNYVWDDTNKIGTVCVDKAHQHITSYNNQWQFTEFDNKEQWLDFIIKNDKRLNFSLDNPDITLDQLLNLKDLLDFVGRVATHLGSSYNKEIVEKIYKKWIEQNHAFKIF